MWQSFLAVSIRSRGFKLARSDVIPGDEGEHGGGCVAYGIELGPDVANQAWELARIHVLRRAIEDHIDKQHRIVRSLPLGDPDIEDLGLEVLSQRRSDDLRDLRIIV